MAPGLFMSKKQVYHEGGSAAKPILSSVFFRLFFV